MICDFNPLLLLSESANDLSLSLFKYKCNRSLILIYANFLSRNTVLCVKWFSFFVRARTFILGRGGLKERMENYLSSIDTLGTADTSLTRH